MGARFLMIILLKSTVDVLREIVVYPVLLSTHISTLRNQERLYAFNSPSMEYDFNFKILYMPFLFMF